MFGRSWPFKAPVREGLVRSWPELLGSSGVPCTVSVVLIKLVSTVFSIFFLLMIRSVHCYFCRMMNWLLSGLVMNPSEIAFMLDQ